VAQRKYSRNPQLPATPNRKKRTRLRTCWAAAEGSEPEPPIDLSQIDFDSLAAAFAGRKRAETDRLASLLKQRAAADATRNPTRYDLVARIEDLIAEYNAGSVNIDEYLRRLVELSKTLTAEEQRAVSEGLTEEELAIYSDALQDNEIRPMSDWGSSAFPLTCLSSKPK